jgi:hypothetical protein
MELILPGALSETSELACDFPAAGSAANDKFITHVATRPMPNSVTVSLRDQQVAVA